VRIIQTLIQNWWLLAFCGILEAADSAVNLLMLDPDGAVTVRAFATRSTAVLLGRLSLAAGLAAIAAALWSSTKGKAWLVALNGLALATYGWVSIFLTKGKLSFLPFAALLAIMALSLGTFALSIAPNLRSHATDKWFLYLAGIASGGFAIVFLTLGFRLVMPARPETFFLWMSAFFGFSALCMLGLGLRLRNAFTPGASLHASS